MSDSLPPPPPPGSPAPPPPPSSRFGTHPPPPPSAHFEAPSHTAGQVPGTASDTAGLRKAAIVLYWLTVAATALLAIALVRRKSVWSDFEASPDFAGLADVDAADDFVGGMVVLVVLVALATTIVVSLWSLRAVRHAKRAGATGVSPGLACGGWYIPIANLVIPYVQLRRAATHFERPTQFLTYWQGLAIATFVVASVLQAIDPGDVDELADVSGRLTTQVVLGLVLVAFTAVMAFIATSAMREVEGV